MLTTFDERFEMDRKKRQEKESKRQVIRNFMAARIEDAYVDRWGHIKVESEGNIYRYKLMENVIRFETKGANSGEWIRLKSYNFKKVYEKALKWQNG